MPAVPQSAYYIGRSHIPKYLSARPLQQKLFLAKIGARKIGLSKCTHRRPRDGQTHSLIPRTQITSATKAHFFSSVSSKLTLKTWALQLSVLFAKHSQVSLNQMCRYCTPLLSMKEAARVEHCASSNQDMNFSIIST